jgi:hypothetical protein
LGTLLMAALILETLRFRIAISMSSLVCQQVRGPLARLHRPGHLMALRATIKIAQFFVSGVCLLGCAVSYRGLRDDPVHQRGPVDGRALAKGDECHRRFAPPLGGDANHGRLGDSLMARAAARQCSRLISFPKKLHTDGQPMPGNEIRLIDEEGREVERGKAGEVVGRSDMMMTEYHNLPEKMREAEWLDAEGRRFIRTRDIGALR